MQNVYRQAVFCRNSFGTSSEYDRSSKYSFYDMIWCDIWYMIWYDMIWYDMWYDMIWYDMVRYDMIWYDMIWYDMIWYDMIYDTWYDMIWYDMIWYMIWYDMIWYDMIWYDMIWYDICLTAIGLTPGGSSTAHIYTKTIHRTTQFIKLAWLRSWIYACEFWQPTTKPPDIRIKSSKFKDRGTDHAMATVYHRRSVRWWPDVSTKFTDLF